ncbi:phosphotransferase [Streptomyces sp. NRRL F-5650]|uniref:phosphotransferase n=1 Tax=Streptomyces sp. NRRL F-5650 TaxID=1463868 RepID=UPI0004C8161B|nr:phosphotransferase [Streptomyces sp. NRRL F-5650]
MLSDTPVAVDRGGYRDTVTPWEEPAWRAEVLAWVRAGFTAHGLRPTGRWRARLRPWSVLLRLEVEEHGAVWFKANPPAGAFEGGLTAALARWVPGHVLEPLAVDTGRGWSLLPDGGPLLRDVLAREAVAPGTWEELVRQYAAVQHALAPRAGDIARLGVPAVPTAALPGVLDRLDDTPQASPERAALRALRPRLTDWCAELDALGVPDSLDHADLHEGQVFHPAPGRFTFFDWGDAVVAHPFAGLAVPARRAAGHHGPRVLPRLRDAYLEPWTDTGRTTVELRRAVSIAWRLSALNRAAAYGRVFPAVTGTAGAATARAGARCLLELLDEPPL